MKFWKVDEPFTSKLPSVAKLEFLKFVLKRVVEKKFEVVAWVPVASEKVKLVRVDDAVERKPFWNTKVVEVAFSPVPSVVHGKANDAEPPQAEPVEVIQPSVDVKHPVAAPESINCDVDAIVEDSKVVDAFEKV
mgnify:CR=1 FL=1